MNRYTAFCFSRLGEHIKVNPGSLSSLRSDMAGARIRIPPEAYISAAYITSLIAAAAGAVVPPVVLSFFRIHVGAVTFIFLIIIAASVFGCLSYAVFMLYPKAVASDRRRKIDSTLPYAVNYMTAMSTAGITPAGIFRLLGHNCVYGESSVEARDIAADVDLFGRDLLEAMRLKGMNTPSERMRDFLQGAVAGISTGSNLTEYFRSKSRHYMNENRQDQKTFLESLGIISESYVTALVAGILFLIILQSIMSAINGSSDLFFLYIIVYGIIPVGSLAFIVLIDTITPEL